MSLSFRAIFEHGVLRPLEPVALRENEVVAITVGEASEPTETNLAAAQRSAILAFVAIREQTAESLERDGLSNRDHDRIIYGP
jgi:predicted DNA-binding antitoxin AbrB/MazE fold protein